MNILIVVDEPGDWALEIPEAKIIAARSYLTGSALAVDKAAQQAAQDLATPTPDAISARAMSNSVKLFNLCKSYRYQSSGYYVSLLAEARGHKPLPTVGAIEDLHSQTLVRHLTEDLRTLIQRLLAPLPGDDFELGIYFGRDTGNLYQPLSRQLFGLLQPPLLSARFERHHDEWSLRSVRAIGASDVPPGTMSSRRLPPGNISPGACNGQGNRHRAPILPFFTTRGSPAIKRKSAGKIQESSRGPGHAGRFIQRADINRLPQFDALFIRDTTFVNHYTYRFSRRALAEGLVVIHEPDSIFKCNNKVYLAELLAHHDVPTPKTLLVHRDNIARIVPELGLPCVLKQPDSSFSRGVVKVEKEAELVPGVTELLAKSALIIAQEMAADRVRLEGGDNRPACTVRSQILFPLGTLAGRETRCAAAQAERGADRGGTSGRGTKRSDQDRA